MVWKRISIVQCLAITAPFGDQVHLKGVTGPPSPSQATYFRAGILHKFGHHSISFFILINFSITLSSCCLPLLYKCYFEKVLLLFSAENAFSIFSNDEKALNSAKTYPTWRIPYLRWRWLGLPNKCWLLMISSMRTLATVTSCKLWMVWSKMSPKASIVCFQLRAERV